MRTFGGFVYSKSELTLLFKLDFVLTVIERFS